MSTLAAQLKDAQSKFAGYLTENKIDPQRVIIASSQLETLQPEDRAIRLAKRQAKGKEDEKAKAARAKKARSGRPVTPMLIARAVRGEKLSGPQKNRILRALNRVAEQKKLSAVELSNLF